MLAQILAIIIFVVMFGMIILEVFERQNITLVCGVLTLLLVFVLGFGVTGHDWVRAGNAVSETLNVKNIFTLEFWYAGAEAHESSSGINWATIIFIAGMMVMVEGMARVGFFRWLCMRLAKAVHYKVLPIFVTFMIMSAVLAMFIDSITVILFLATVTIELSQLLKFNPLPMILSEIFCANLGGSATMCGDPPNIIIGTSFGYSFMDFLTNTGVMAGICLIFIVLFFFFAYRKELKCSEVVDTSTFPSPASAITDKAGFAISSVIFFIAVVLLVTHSMTELSVATIGVIATILTVISISIAFGFKDVINVIKRVDYKTLLFFVGLFVVVSGLEETGCLEVVANFIGKVSGGKVIIMIAIILWMSAILSAFVDNIPFAATMVPVIQAMAASTGVPLETLAWTLALGTDIGGSATPIGASANVVGTSLVAKAGHPVSWGKYCKYNAPATIIVMTICMLCLFAKYA